MSLLKSRQFLAPKFERPRKGFTKFIYVYMFGMIARFEGLASSASTLAFGLSFLALAAAATYSVAKLVNNK